MMDSSSLIDDVTKIISTVCGILTVYLAWREIIPRLREIHTQTNSLAVKAEAGAHAMGIQEGLRQAGEAVKEAARTEAGIP